MKAGNGSIKKFGADKIIHGPIRMLTLAVCVVVSVFLFRVSFLSVLGDMVLGTVVAYLAGEWKGLEDDVPDTADIRATMWGVYLAVSIILLIWSTIWIIRLLFQHGSI